MHVQRGRGDDGPGQVAVAVFGAVHGDRVQQRDDLGELVGVRGDGALTDDNPLAVHERGEQPDLPAAGVHLGPGAFERLAVQRERGEGRDLPGGEPPGAHLLGQPAPDQDVRLVRVDGLYGAPDRRLARRHEPAGARVPAGAEPLQRLRRQVCDVVRDRPEAGGAGQRRGRDHRADGRDPVADPPFLSRVGQPFEEAEQPAVPGQRDRVHVDSSSGCEQRMRVGSGEDGRRVAVQ